MPPKTKFSQEVVLEAAYQLAREGGFNALSARLIADRLGSSTAPIYSCYPSMDELVHAVFDTAKGRMGEYMRHQWTAEAFLNMGIGIVMFARDESVLFRTLLFDAPALSIASNDEEAENISMMSADPTLATLPEADMAKLLEKMSVITYGLASIVASGSLPEADVEFVAHWLSDIGSVVIQDQFRRAETTPTDDSTKKPEIINSDPPLPGK